MSRPIRVCSVLDCGRQNHAQGYCRRHYHEKVSKARAQHPANGVSAKRAEEVPIRPSLAVVR